MYIRSKNDPPRPRRNAPSGLLAAAIFICQLAALAPILSPPQAAGQSLWDNTATPDIVSYSISEPYELGTKFRSDVRGYITALRFYKSPSDTGTHTGELWTDTGALLATVPYTNETPSGWQEVQLPTPVAIQANTTYVVSYLASGGYVALSRFYFTSSHDNPPLHALADGTDGSNGVGYGGGTGFPNESYESTNYWADVVFASSGSTPAPPPVTGGAGGTTLWDKTATPDIVSYSISEPYELGTKFRSDVRGYITALRFYKSPSDTGTHTGELWTDSGALLATVPYTNETPSGWQEVSLPTPVAIQANTTYVVSYLASGGYVALSRFYFKSSHDNPPLHAPADGTDGSNGVGYGGGTGFPNESYESTNYWADVVFATSGSSGGGGTQSLTSKPASLSFGNVTLGGSSVLPIVLTSAGTGSVTISQYTATGTGFGVTGPSLPLTLAPGGNATLSVSFNPVTAGGVSGSVSIISDAAGSPSVVPLSATGVTTVSAHSVTVSWTPSTSSNVIGYNVYRASTSGGPYTKLNSSPVAAVAYTDTTVEGGLTYYYVATAVDSAGLESVYSNEIQAVIPSS